MSLLHKTMVAMRFPARITSSGNLYQDCDLSKASVVRNLGAWLDDQLTMAVHMTKICSAAFYHLHNIRRFRKYLSVDAATNLILLVAEQTTVTVYYMVYQSAILTSCREFKTQPPDLSLCRPNFAILPQCSISTAALASCLIS